MLPPYMNAGLCVCVVLAVLCASCLGLPFSSQPLDEGQRPVSALSEAVLEADTHTLGDLHLRHRRSAPQLKALPLAEEDADSRANLSELLARLISSRKGSVRRNSTANSKGVGPSANHRIADRDYLGWMDFGRRSAEEYEYSS
uniref:Cholecystokinin n=3 Tax=Oreochromis niloticus TaxID=8128 RepID=A0A669CEK8_ORENI